MDIEKELNDVGGEIRQTEATVNALINDEKETC